MDIKMYKSQDKEDVILESLYRSIPDMNTIVEIGASHPEEISNSWYVINRLNFNALLIESDKCKHDIIYEYYKNNSKVSVKNQMITSDNINDTLNFYKYVIKKDIDIVSIDIDGEDYNVWEAIGDKSIKVFIIEFNPTIHPDLSINQNNTNYRFGASYTSLVELGNKKGYTLIACTKCNCIFIENSYLDKIENFDFSFNKKFSLYPIANYDGRLLFYRNGNIFENNNSMSIDELFYK